MKNTNSSIGGDLQLLNGSEENNVCIVPEGKERT
jgi:hypothetical protein